MQIVSIGDILHEISMPVFWEKYFFCRLQKFLSSMHSIEIYENIHCEYSLEVSQYNMYLQHMFMEK